MTLGSHQSAIGKSQAHISPPQYVKAIGPFGFDPCAAPPPRFFDCAKENWHEGGLVREWPRGLLFYANPPFDQRVVGFFVERAAQHGNGILLLHARIETAWFRPCWDHASGILFLAKRIKFLFPDGREQPSNSGAPVALIAFGPTALERLRNSGLVGSLVTGWRWQGAGSSSSSRRTPETTS
jgi:DNA N-6-adenine-methyltransferase (Dam)